MATYSQIKNGLDEIASKIEQARSYINNGRTSLVRAQTDLGNMPSKWSALLGEIDQAVTDNPGDAVFETAQAKKTKLIANFQDLKAYADSLVVAWDATEE